MSIPLLVVGAGPCGLSIGIAAAKAGLGCVILDRRTVVSTIERYPLGMTFFSTPEKIEIGGVPLVTSTEKPTRRDGLVYYRRVAEAFGLDIRVGEAATRLVRRADGAFEVHVRRANDETMYVAERVVIATGYYDNPNFIGVPGEMLPHVSHYFVEGHRHYRQHVIIVGAGNSAVDAALECWRAGADVTLVHRGDALHPTVKPWVLPDITNRLKEGSIASRWRRSLVEITPTHVVVRAPDGSIERLPADAVLIMTGYRPDMSLLRSVGVEIDAESGVPAHDPMTLETPVRGLYVAGVLVGGNDDNRLFIENTRDHGNVIVADIMTQQGIDPAASVTVSWGGSART